MEEWISTLISTVFGGIVTAGVAYFTLRHENKRYKKEQINDYQLNNAHFDREKKIELYAGILDAIGDGSIAISLEATDDNELQLIDTNEYKRRLEKLQSFYQSNYGTISLFLPKEINRELRLLTATLYQLSCEKSTVAPDANASEQCAKIGETELVKMMEQVHQISINIRKDIEKDSFHIPTSFLVNPRLERLQQLFSRKDSKQQVKAD